MKIKSKALFGLLALTGIASLDASWIFQKIDLKMAQPLGKDFLTKAGIGILGLGFFAVSDSKHYKKNMVKVYHGTQSQKHSENIKKHGLYSSIGQIKKEDVWIDFCKSRNIESEEKCREQHQKALLWLNEHKKKEDNGGFDDQYDLIYFSPDHGGTEQRTHFAIEVDPDKTYVHNLHYRAKAHMKDPYQDRAYRASKVLLSTYLQYVKEAEQMRVARPDVQVRLDPQTARPFYLEENDPRKNNMAMTIDGVWIRDEHYVRGMPDYQGEVTVATDHIPFAQIIVLPNNKSNEFRS